MHRPIDLGSRIFVLLLRHLRQTSVVGQLTFLGLSEIQAKFKRLKKGEPMRAALDVERKPGSLTWLGFLNVKRPRWIIGWTGKRRWMFFDF